MVVRGRGCCPAAHAPTPLDPKRVTGPRRRPPAHCFIRHPVPFRTLQQAPRCTSRPKGVRPVTARSASHHLPAAAPLTDRRGALRTHTRTKPAGTAGRAPQPPPCPPPLPARPADPSVRPACPPRRRWGGAPGPAAALVSRSPGAFRAVGVGAGGCGPGGAAGVRRRRLREGRAARRRSAGLPPLRAGDDVRKRLFLPF